jgi:activator of HSP90 ATPase
MPQKDHGPSVKDDELYEKLRKQGESKEKAARIANASANEGRSKVSRRGGKSGTYEDMPVDELRKKAAKVGIEGRSKMKKRELVSALRNH